MKQIIQSYRTGELELAEIPAPGPRPGRIIVRNVASVLSVGTERYMLELARKSLLGKAIARPDLVRQMINKVRAEGPAEAWRQAKGRLDDPVPLGYSSAGVVVSTGDGIEDFPAGVRVACSGAIYAAHAELVSVPRTMLVRIPAGVGFEEASFVTLGGIALHGVRMAEPAVGERIVVLGLGLLGLLAVQILKSAGCRVLAADVTAGKVAFARELGADEGAVIGEADLATAARAFSGGPGADAVLVFAASDSNEPVMMAAEAARERGRLVVPGLVGLDLPRKIFYEKELSFLVSRAWGPGIYDPHYEAKGLDYPIAQVRWTAQRNLGAFLDLVADGGVRLAPLISHRFPIERAVEAYNSILAGKERFLGVVLTYPEAPDSARTISLRSAAAPGLAPSAPVGASRPVAESPAARDLTPRPVVRVGIIGAGLFAKGTILPLLKGKPGVELRGLAAGSGVGAHHSGRRNDFAWCTTDTERVLSDPDIDLVLVLTRHGSHADLVARALRAGKHVFVEKPLALDEAQLAEVTAAWVESRGQLMVGFNRRYAPLVREATRRLASVPRPLVVTMRVNAGFVPKESWVHDPDEGGGRIVGEVCHFVDLASGLCGSLPVEVQATAATASASTASGAEDLLLTLKMTDGSIVSICYTAGGDKAFSRERVEIFGGGAACAIENFRSMIWSRNGRSVRRGRSWSGVDRGHAAEIAQLLDCVRAGKPLPVSFEDAVATTRATFAALESLRIGMPVAIAS